MQYVRQLLIGIRVSVACGLGPVPLDELPPVPLEAEPPPPMAPEPLLDMDLPVDMDVPPCPLAAAEAPDAAASPWPLPLERLAGVVLQPVSRTAASNPTVEKHFMDGPATIFLDSLRYGPAQQHSTAGAVLWSAIGSQHDVPTVAVARSYAGQPMTAAGHSAYARCRPPQFATQYFGAHIWKQVAEPGPWMSSPQLL